jgi:hypothetical protein
MAAKPSRPSFWYLGGSVLTALPAYPGIVWLPGFVERTRIGGALLPTPVLAARNLGEMLWVVALALFALFILSAFLPKIRSLRCIQAVSFLLILVYSMYTLLLMGCLLFIH